MTTQRINHRAAAVGCMHYAEDRADPGDEAMMVIASAEVHATLALAEQVRVSTLVQMAWNAPTSELARVAGDAISLDGETLRPEVAAVLGVPQRRDDER